MKKVLATSLLLISSMSYTSAVDLDLSWLDSLWTDITNQVMWDVNVMMDDFWTWQENFDTMMEDFQTNLENDLNEMTNRINSMMDWIMSDLDKQMTKLESDLEWIANELPEKVVWNLDVRLDNFFEKLETNYTDSEEYMSTLNKLTDKIEKLDNAWKFKTKTLQDAVDYLWTKTEIEKNEIVKTQAEWIKSKDTEDLTEEELESVKELFDSLEAEVGLK